MPPNTNNQGQPGGFKTVKHGSLPATPRQAEYYELLTAAVGNKQSLPSGTNRVDAMNIIANFLKVNPSLRGRSLKILKGMTGGKPTPKAAPAAKPIPKPKPTRFVIPWPPTPPAPDPLTKPHEHLLIKPDDPEVKKFKPRQPYWDILCDLTSEGFFPQLVGPMGCGKSLMPKMLAFALSRPYLPINCDGKLNPRTLNGQISIRNGTSFFTMGEFAMLCQVPSVIALEERNMLDGSVEAMFNRILNNREYFIPEANGGAGMVVKLHPQCIITQDCNPPGAKFTGAQRQNIATVDRATVINMPQLTKAEVIDILDHHKDAGRLADFYIQAADIVESNGFRAGVSLRGLMRAARLIDKGYTEREAIELGALNAVALTGGPDAYSALANTAKSMFRI